MAVGSPRGVEEEEERGRRALVEDEKAQAAALQPRQVPAPSAEELLAADLVRVTVRCGACFLVPLGYVERAYPRTPLLEVLKSPAAKLCCSADTFSAIYTWLTERRTQPGIDAASVARAARVLGVADLAVTLRGIASHPSVSAQDLRSLCRAPPVLLPAASLRMVNAQGLTLRNAVLTDADLSHADLSSTDLSGAVLDAATLSRADLSCASLTCASLESADLRNCSLRRSLLQEADLRGAWLSGADATDAVFTMSNFCGAVGLRSAVLLRSLFNRARLTDVDLSGADLTGVDLSEADLSGAVLAGAALNGACLWRTVLSGADLRGARLGAADTGEEAVLTEAVVDGESLQGAVLRGADLRGVRVQGLPRAFAAADLRNADLRDTDLSGADLSEAAIGGVVLAGADVRDTTASPSYVSVIRVRVTITNTGSFAVRRVVVRRCDGDKLGDHAAAAVTASSETREYGARSLLGGRSHWLPTGRGSQWAVVKLHHPVAVSSIKVKHSGAGGKVAGVDVWSLPHEPGGAAPSLSAAGDELNLPAVAGAALVEAEARRASVCSGRRMSFTQHRRSSSVGSRRGSAFFDGASTLSY
eukprot:TRINITY_DN20242_c0_g1_i2.p1 TRINITY_DN20242_c0_g1~~TRINITY_DN20242_c0_g1_i2.p1  ORF type:complete len:607 (+),score=179.29 TRINITY_DN20242_c0_g1_i2:56-1822(+)